MALDNTVIPVSWLRTQFCYDPKTGVITNGPGRPAPAKVGADPTYPLSNGYLALKVTYEGVRYTFMAHRLAFALKKGRHPVGEVDHDNHRRSENWWLNLREATKPQNIANRVLAPRDLPQGVTKVRKKSKRPFIARIAVAGRRLHLGAFSCPKKAGRAYRAAAKLHYGAFAVKPQGKFHEQRPNS